ncbi:MAG: hypothetical protein LCH81_22595 [Bacteroidetes bacterium]|nr:hypothetical protein [Bacteroidota bacterium]
MSTIFSLSKTFFHMNQKFFASPITKHLRVFVLLFIVFGAAQQLSAQSLVDPALALNKLKVQSVTVDDQLNTQKGTDTQIGLQYLRLEYYKAVSEILMVGAVSTQQAVDKGALVMAERFQTLPHTSVTLTASHVQTVVSETTSLLLN